MTGYTIGDQVEITYSPSMRDPQELTVTGTLIELERPCRFRYADHLVVRLADGASFTFDEGDDLALWSIAKV
jgi:hypothetical protein